MEKEKTKDLTLLEQHREKLNAIRELSKQKCEDIYLELKKALPYVILKKGLAEVKKTFKRANLKEVVLCILSTSVHNPYLLTEIEELALMHNIPIFYTDSNYFVSALVDKHYSASCALVTSLKEFIVFNEFRVV